MSYEQIIDDDITALTKLEKLQRRTFIDAKVKIEFTIFSSCETPSGREYMELRLDGDAAKEMVTALVGHLRAEVKELTAHLKECAAREQASTEEQRQRVKAEREAVLKRALLP